MTRRRVSIFGATGSIGQSTLDLIGRDPDRFEVVALTGGRNVELLAKDARALGAEIAVTAYEDCHGALKAALAGSGSKSPPDPPLCWRPRTGRPTGSCPRSWARPGWPRG